MNRASLQNSPENLYFDPKCRLYWGGGFLGGGHVNYELYWGQKDFMITRLINMPSFAPESLNFVLTIVHSEILQIYPLSVLAMLTPA